MIFRKSHAASKTAINETSQSTNGVLYFRQIFVETVRPEIVVCDNQRDAEEAANIRTLPLSEGKERE